jgi:hypothetical protein
VRSLLSKVKLGRPVIGVHEQTAAKDNSTPTHIIFLNKALLLILSP